MAVDELEAQERALRDAIDSRDDWAKRQRAAEASERESLGLLAEAVDSMGRWMKEVQLPLHILLSSPFGELNENQEEILAAARSATDAADVHLRQLAKLVELETGEVSIVPQPMNVAELLRPALAIAEARSANAHVSFRANVPQNGPRVIVDPVHAQEALSALLVEAVERTAAGGEVRVDSTDDERGCVRIVVIHGEAPATISLVHRLARRLVEAQHGELLESPGQTIISLPREGCLARAAGAG